MTGVLKRRSLVFVVSDFYSIPGWEVALGVLTLRHEVLAVRIHDPRETDLPDLGSVWFEDAETGSQVLVDTHDAKFRRRLIQAAIERDKELATAFRKAGVDVQVLSTGDDFVRSLLAWTGRRQFRKSHPGGTP
jgi:uncharacterized protein (DUF58 family)